MIGQYHVDPESLSQLYTAVPPTNIDADIDMAEYRRIRAGLDEVNARIDKVFEAMDEIKRDLGR